MIPNSDSVAAYSHVAAAVVACDPSAAIDALQRAIWTGAVTLHQDSTLTFGAESRLEKAMREAIAHLYARDAAKACTVLEQAIGS